MIEKIKEKIEKFLKQETSLIAFHSLLKDFHISNKEFEILFEAISVNANYFGFIYYIYLDINEYSGFNLSEQKIKKQKEIIKSNDFFKWQKMFRWSAHQTLSVPVFISWKKIRDVPSYIDEMPCYSATSLNNPENVNKFIQWSNMSIGMNYKALRVNKKSKNIIYENEKNGKSIWMNDVNKGKLF